MSDQSPPPTVPEILERIATLAGLPEGARLEPGAGLFFSEGEMRVVVAALDAVTAEKDAANELYEKALGTLVDLGQRFTISERERDQARAALRDALTMLDRFEFQDRGDCAALDYWSAIASGLAGAPSGDTPRESCNATLADADHDYLWVCELPRGHASDHESDDGIDGPATWLNGTCDTDAHHAVPAVLMLRSGATVAEFCPECVGRQLIGQIKRWKRLKASGDTPQPAPSTNIRERLRDYLDRGGCYRCKVPLADHTPADCDGPYVDVLMRITELRDLLGPAPSRGLAALADDIAERRKDTTFMERIGLAEKPDTAAWAALAKARIAWEAGDQAQAYAAICGALEARAALGDTPDPEPALPGKALSSGMDYRPTADVPGAELSPEGKAQPTEEPDPSEHERISTKHSGWVHLDRPAPATPEAHNGG